MNGVEMGHESDEGRANPEEMHRAVALISAPGSIIELRALDTDSRELGPTVSGYYDSPRPLVHDAGRLSGHANVYITLNPANPALLARAHNRLESYAKHTTSDADIVSRRWLAIDFDATRPAGISSTDQEHLAAIERAMATRDSLCASGWPSTFILADSGNGAHLLFRIDLPNDDGARDLVKRTLEGLHTRFTDAVVQIDRTTCNAARIWKLYGTLAVKGDNLSDRPHRLACILEAPSARDDFQIVAREQLEAIAAPAPKLKSRGAQSDTHASSNFDPARWIDEHGIKVKTRTSWNGGERWILERCPFDPSHAGTSVAILRFPSGAVEFKCQHNGCADKKWADLRELFEPGRRHARERFSTKAVEKPDLNGKPQEIPPGFKLTEDTLYVLREVKTKDGSEVKEHQVCSRLEVVALTRDDSGGEWGRLLRFKDLDESQHEWAMPTEMLAGEGTEYRARLWQQGLRIWPTKEARHGLHEYISQCQPTARARAVTRVGWHDGVFVLPDATFGDLNENERTLYQSAVSVNHAFNVRGTLEEWQREISARCVGNSRLTFAVSAGFAPPLLHLTNDESGGFHFVGSSSLGKTTALRVGGSVWGGSHEPAGYLRQWRATANGLEGIAAMHCDALICLDEMGQVNAREAGEVGYLLANGQGKGRARRDGSARSPFTWRVLFLSSGEITLADKIREDGRQRATAGQQVRILDIPAEAGNFGLFENLHGAASGQEFADALRNATQRNYGTAARAFLPEIAKHAERIADKVREYRDAFIAQHRPAGASEQVGRGAARFGLVAAAGELATVLGLTGWDADAATEAAGACFEAWLALRGHAGPAEIEAGIEQVRHFFALHGGSRFGMGNASDIDSHGRTVLNRAGFCKDGNFWVYPEVFRKDIAAGYDCRALTDALAARALLRRDKDGKVQCPVRDPGSGKLIRMLCFMPAILGEEVADDEGL